MLYYVDGGSTENLEFFIMEFDVVDDVAEELEHFLFLTGLGDFKEVRVLHKHNPAQILQGFFQCFVEYLDMLLENSQS